MPRPRWPLLRALAAQLATGAVIFGSAFGLAAGTGIRPPLMALLALQGVAFFYWCPISGGAMFLFVWAMDRRPFEWSGIAAHKIS